MHITTTITEAVSNFFGPFWSKCVQLKDEASKLDLSKMYLDETLDFLLTSLKKLVAINVNSEPCLLTKNMKKVICKEIKFPFTARYFKTELESEE